MLELYNNIKKYRQINNLTQESLAKKVGYADKGMISRIENGKVDLPQSQIIKFADALNVSPGTLMGIDGSSSIDTAMERAISFYERYENASPEIRSAIETLLKASKGE